MSRRCCEVVILSRRSPESGFVVSFSLEGRSARSRCNILLGLAKENHGVAAQILRDLGVDGNKIHSETLARLSSP